MTSKPLSQLLEEAFVQSRDMDASLAERLQAFADAGADVVYAQGISDIATVRAICSSVPRPVNVLAVSNLSVADLAAAGVKRVSLGSKLTNSAFGAIKRAAAEILDSGTFGFSRDGMPFDELTTLFSKR